MKKLIFVLVLVLFQVRLFGQESKTINFNGYQQWNYQNPMMMPSGKWEAWYQNSGQRQISGSITLNENTKVFKITYDNGENWSAKNIKKKVLNEVSDEFGDVIRTYYDGIWVDNQEEARLVITVTKDNSCVFQVYSRRVKDEEKKIDCYRKITTFFANGKCFE